MQLTRWKTTRPPNRRSMSYTKSSCTSIRARGSERGYCVVMGQKVPVERPRVRTTDDREVRLGSYEMFHRGEPLTETVWEKLMLGLSTRKYGEAVRQFTEAYGLEK